MSTLDELNNRIIVIENKLDVLNNKGKSNTKEFHCLMKQLKEVKKLMEIAKKKEIQQ